MQQNSDLLVINSISTCFGHLYAHHQGIQLRSPAYSCLSCCSCCDAGESGGKLTTQKDLGRSFYNNYDFPLYMRQEIH